MESMRNVCISNIYTRLYRRSFWYQLRTTMLGVPPLAHPHPYASPPTKSCTWTSSLAFQIDGLVGGKLLYNMVASTSWGNQGTTKCSQSWDQLAIREKSSCSETVALEISLASEAVSLFQLHQKCQPQCREAQRTHCYNLWHLGWMAPTVGIHLSVLDTAELAAEGKYMFVFTNDTNSSRASLRQKATR